MEFINNILNAIISSFDLGFCTTVNIATYIIIKFIDECNNRKKLKCYIKRIVLLIVSVILGTIYYIDGCCLKVIINSIILAPVFWSWILKPICIKLKVDYAKEIE